MTAPVGDRRRAGWRGAGGRSNRLAPTRHAGAAGATDPDIPRDARLALAALIAGSFATTLSATLLSNALPRILADLRGSQTAYTWVVTGMLLTMTITTPVWGRLSDLIDKKLLAQLGLGLYVGGSVLAGLSLSSGMLIGCRVIQGIGTGCSVPITQIIIAELLPPQRRGRYTGYLGASFATSTVIGPLLGGLVVGTSWLGWRPCLMLGVPVAAVAMVMLQRYLHLPKHHVKVRVDYVGSLLLGLGVSLLLVWVTLAGQSFAWMSSTSLLLVTASVATLAAMFVVERRVESPVVPLKLFRNRTFTLGVTASALTGPVVFMTPVFLGQYFQIGRNHTPLVAGLLTGPLIVGLFVSSLVGGRLMGKTSRWKRVLVSGAVLMSAGVAILGLVTERTSMTVLGVAMALIGIGQGLTSQNLVLPVQHAVPAADVGAASAAVIFFRTLGGAVVMGVMGAVLNARVGRSVQAGMSALGQPVSDAQSRQIPDMTTLSEPVRRVFESAYGHGVAEVFLLTTPLMLIAALALAGLRTMGRPPRDTVRTPAPARPAPAAD